MNNPETWENGKKKGSITAEASIALSLFLLFFLLMIYFYLLLNLEMNMQNAIENAADLQMVSSMAPEEIRLNTVSVRLNTVFLKQYVIAELGADYLNSCWIRGGSSGLYFGKSSLEEEADEIRVVVSYYIRIPFWGLRDIHIVQSAVRRKWIGADSSSMESESEKGDRVYITEDGSVYHLYEDCSYIHVKLEKVTYQELETLRNEDGHIYYACQSCKPDPGGYVYISRYGEHYHASKSCKAIQKNYKAVSPEEAGGRRVCSKCAKRAGI